MVQQKIKRLLMWPVSDTGKSLPDPRSYHWLNPECVSNLYQSDV